MISPIFILIEDLNDKIVTSIFAHPDDGIAGIFGVFEIVMRHGGVT